jgi:phage terminase large subunit-like protein
MSKTILTAFKNHPNCLDGFKYALSVVGGKRVECQLIVAACQRQLDDFERQKFEYEFDADAAERVCKFIQLLPHTKGRWAAQRKKLILEPWQKFAVICLFGWVHKKTGLRRFNRAYIKISRKNGKSLLAAGIGLYMLCADGEHGAEVYSGATTEKQAFEVFRPAKLMAIKTPALCQRYDVDINAKSLVMSETGGKFEPIIGKPGDGSSPSCAIIDEYHEHLDSTQYDTMQTGMGARDQPLLLVITTAGTDMSSPCYVLEKDAEAVLRRQVVDENFFVLPYGIDPEDDWRDLKSIKKANPNYGVSISEDFLKQQLAQAIASTSKQNTFRIKHLNQWVNAKLPWLNMTDWEKCGDSALSLEQFEGGEVYLALDLARRIDIAALIFLFVREIDGLKHFYIFLKCYLPAETIERQDNYAYVQWVNEGWLTKIDGKEINDDFIFADIEYAKNNFKIKELVYDPWKAADIIKKVDAEEILAVEFRQTVQNMSPAMKELEAAVTAGRLHHNNNPILSWMASNVTAKVDVKENIYPNKDKVHNKIDGLVASIMAVGRAMADEEIDEPFQNLRSL